MRTYLPEIAQHFVQTLLMSIEFDHIHWHDTDIPLLDTLAVSSFWENSGNLGREIFGIIFPYLCISSSSPQASHESSQISQPWHRTSRLRQLTLLRCPSTPP